MLRPDDFIISDQTPSAVITPGTHARGLIPRPFEQFPQGCYKSATAFDMPLIPRSEWAERIQDGEANQSFISHVRRRSGPNGGLIPSLDQNGKGYCHTADTEVLTDRGWTPWPEYNYSDLLATINPITGFMEFQSPLERHVYKYDGEMVHSTNRRLDFGVTPDHRMMVRKWDERRRTLSDQYTFQRAGDLGWYAGFMPAPRGFIGTELKRVAVEGDREYDGNDFAALVALVTSDGFAGGAEGSRPGKGTRSLVSFAAFRPDRREATAALASRLGFAECPSRPGVWNRWNAGALAAWFRSNAYTSDRLGADRKRVPDIIKTMTGRQISHFLDFFGDRSYGPNNRQFYSTSKRLTDDLQELHLRIGKRGTIGRSAPRTHQILDNQNVSNCKALFTLTIGEADRLCVDYKKHIETDRYKGLVYCAAVPNGTLVTRRNGSVLISGNCWAHSTVMALILLRALMGQAYVRLSAFMVACIVKAYRDKGGWGAQSLDFITENGVPSVEFWPEKSMSRSNDNAAMRANAALHKPVEVWADLQAAQYDRNLTEDQAMTVLLSRIPLVADWNWWGHSTCMMDPTLNVNPTEATSARWTAKLATDFDSLDLNNPTDAAVMAEVFGKRGINSWTDSYGKQGEFVLTGSKAHLDGGVAPRVAVPSTV